jgi:hypothetical protein
MNLISDHTTIGVLFTLSFFAGFAAVMMHFA